MEKFTLKPEYFCDVIIEYGYPSIMTGEPCYVTFHEDHPSFAWLRKELANRGFIKMEQGFWNGDYVIKPFYLNDRLFEIGEKFACATAQGFENGRF